MTGRHVRMPTLLPLWRKARRVSSAASRLPGFTSLRFALHGWQRMITRAPSRTTQEKRPALWDFEQLNTLRRRIIQRAGRLIRPQGWLTLSMSTNQSVQNELLHYLDEIEKAA